MTEQYAYPLAEREDSRDADKRREIEEDLAAHPPGSLGLPARLDKVRIERGIPSCFFKYEAIGNNCLAMQLEPGGGRTFLEGGRIIKPDVDRWAEKRASHQGILIAAGLTALDYLRIHGVELGDHVMFVRNAPYHPEVGRWGWGEAIQGVDLVAEDIRASVDLAKRRIAGDLKTTCTRRTGKDGVEFLEHLYTDADGNLLRPEEKM